MMPAVYTQEPHPKSNYSSSADILLEQVSPSSVMGKKIRWRLSVVSRERILSGNALLLIKEDKLEINDDSKMPELPNIFRVLSNKDKV